MNTAMAKRIPMIREENIPEELKEFPHWVVWRYEENKKPGKKPLKVPYYVTGKRRRGALGTEQDVSKLATFRAALRTARAEGYDGVGLAVLKEQDLTILDIDDCIDKHGEFSEFAIQVIHSASYVERSPSGRGLRAVYKGALVNGTKRNFHIDNGERVEVYCGNAYTTFTGNQESKSGVEIRTLPRAIRRRLLDGMAAEGIDPNTPPEEWATNSDGDGEALASMNAARIPNMTTAQALRVLKALPKRWGASGEGTWFQVAAALHMQFRDNLDEAYEVLDKWSSERDGYDPESNAARWAAGFSHSRGKQNVLSLRNLVFEARDAGAKFKRETLESWGLTRAAQEKAAESEIELPEDREAEDVLDAAWIPLDIKQWATDQRPQGTPPLVKNWIYEGTVVLFSSHGGAGKSYVMMTFAALASTGGMWFGEQMKQGGVLLVNGEDPKEEIGHRLWGICSRYGIDVADLDGVLDIVDVTPVLHKALYTAGTDFGKTEFTKQFYRLQDMIESGKYKYLVLDNLAKFYMANENARPMVDEFVSALAAMGAAHGVGVVLVGHDSKLGQGYSGSTAWHNSARARWALQTENGVRTLTVEKSNYGKANHGGLWAWDETHSILGMGGAVGSTAPAAEFSDIELEEAVYMAVCELYAMGEHTHPSKRGRIGPIEEHQDVVLAGGNQANLRGILEKLYAAGRIVIRQYRAKDRHMQDEYVPAEAVAESPEEDLING